MLDHKTLKEIEKSVLHRTTFLRKLNQTQMVELLNKGKFWEDMLRANYNAMRLELMEYKKELDEALDRVSGVNLQTLEVTAKDDTGRAKGQAKKPIFEEAKRAVSIPQEVVNYEARYNLPVAIDTVVEHIDVDGYCVLIPLDVFEDLKNALTGTNYLFYQSRSSRTNKMDVWVWKA